MTAPVITPEELQRRFDYHPPKSSATVQAHESVRDRCWLTASHIVADTPPGREQSLAITHLEEAMFWANAAIARNQPNGEQQ